MAGTYKRGRKIWSAVLIIFLVCSISVYFLSLIPKPVKASWLAGYTYRKSANIVGSSGAGLNYQIMVKVMRSSGTDSGNTVYVSNHCKEDFSDIRFADADGNVFPYAIVYQTSDEAWFWIKITTLDLSVDQTIYMYYGNPDAVSESNPDETFIFYEDWDSETLDTDKWTWYADTYGSYTIDTTNHRFIIYTTSGYSIKPYIKSDVSDIVFPSSWIIEDYYGENQAFTVDWYHTVDSNPLGATRWASFGLGTAVPNPTTSSAFVDGYYIKYTKTKDFRCGVGSNTDWNSTDYNWRSFYPNLWKIVRSGDTWKIYWNGTLVHSEDNSEEFSLISFRANTCSYERSILGAFKIRKYVEPEPYISSWGEETTFKPTLYVGSNVETYFKLDGTKYSTPYSEQVDFGTYHSLEALYSTIIINASYHYGFSHWEKNGEWYSDDLTIDTGAINEDVNFTMVYTNVRFNVSSDGVEGIAVSVSGSTLYTPFIAYRGKGATSFQVLTLTKKINQTHSYCYIGAYVNGSFYSGEATFTITAYGDTDVLLDYEVVYSPPESNEPVITPSTSEATWYFRNDLHTVQDEIGYKLSEQNSMTTESYSEDVSADLSITLGFRAWVFNKFGKTEITPNVVGLYTISSNGTHEVNSTWIYTGSNEIVYAVEIKIYLRFGEGDWITMLVAITDDDLNIIIPEGTWRIFYNVELFRNSTYTKATLYWGSPEYDTRITLPTAAASPWDVALLKLLNLDLIGWLLTPFTFHLGDLFYSIIVLFLCITAYNDTGSLSYVLAILWLFGGGGILASFLSPITLNIAYILLAFATAFTLMKLILK